jgi:hypothetical protein
MITAVTTDFVAGDRRLVVHRGAFAPGCGVPDTW